MKLFLLLLWLPVTVNAANDPQRQYLPSCEIGDNDVVISFDLLGGMSPRTSNEPRFTVQSNGKVTLGNPQVCSQHDEKQNDSKRMQQLPEVIVKKERFFAIEVPAIPPQRREEVSKTGRIFAIADAAESVIRVCSGNNHKRVKFYALAHAAKQYPEIEALQRLYAVEQELRRMATWLRVGGDEGAQSALTLVNDYLSAKHPDITLVTLENLDSAVSDPNGNLTVYFSRRGFVSSEPGMRNMSVIVHRPSGKSDKSTVTVNLE